MSIQSEGPVVISPSGPGARSVAVGVLASVMMMIVPAARADLAAGRDAFDRGDYAAAEAAWRPDADRGIAEGELGLGEVYEQGYGDYRQAAYWYEKAAEAGNIEARYRLALISAAGDADVPADPVRAYKWAILAADPGDVWGQLAGDLRKLLEQRLSATEEREGQRQAQAWRDKHQPKVAVAVPLPVLPAGELLGLGIEPPIPPAPGVKGKRGLGDGCTPPGWPGPPLPCSSRPLPAPPGEAPLSPPTIGAAVAPVAPPPSAAGITSNFRSVQDALDEILKTMPCATLRKISGVGGRPVIKGTVPAEADRARLIRAVARLPAVHARIAVDIVGEPLCSSLVEFDSMRAIRLVSDRLDARLAHGNRLREGDPINVEVTAGAYPVYVRIDYFTLDGQVMHLSPGDTPIAARSRDVFGTGTKPGEKPWFAGGAPFGTELITVLATPQKLQLGDRPPVEQASEYIDALRTALRDGSGDDRQPNLLSTMLVHTAPR
jgi:hypothetical protein